MVQIIPRGKGGLEQFLEAMSGATQGLSEGVGKIKGAMNERDERNALAERFGDEFKNVRNPNVQKLLIEGKQQQELQDKKRKEELDQIQKAYPIIKKRFGQEAADILPHLSTGAQTDYISSLLKNEARNKGFGDRFGDPEEQEEMPDDMAIGNSEPISQKPKIKDFDAGLLPEERARREDKRYGINLPLYTESLNKKNAAQTQQQELGILSDLSPQISAIERININPKTGELLLPAAASTEAQRYAKTINDFTRTAKESYGARVTNFDLTQFLKRLPTLANSQEGRRQIIEQLQIFNDLDLAHAQALQDAFDSHGGIRKLDYDKASQVADKKMQGLLKDARSKLSKIGTTQENEYKTQVEDFKKMTPQGRVAVRKADGTMGDIEKDKLSAFLKIEGNEVL